MTDYPAEQKRFEKSTANHVMAVLHDDGLYRHIRFQAPDTGMYWYSLITSPGQLTFWGDMGCYVFARVQDMFEFFNRAHIEPDYWGEKLQAHSGWREYSEPLMRKLVREHFDDQVDRLTDPQDVWREIDDQIFNTDVAPYEDQVHHALNDFDHGGLQFEDSWEWDLRDYTVHYLWTCHAIRSGVQQYLAFEAWLDRIERDAADDILAVNAVARLRDGGKPTLGSETARRYLASIDQAGDGDD